MRSADPQPYGCVTWRPSNAHVTLPADLDEAWDLLTRPDDLAGWLGREVVLDPTPGAAGRGRRPRRHACATWSSTRGRAGPPPGVALVGRRRRRAEPATWRSPSPRSSDGTARARGRGAGAGATPGRAQAAGPARRGRTGSCTSRRCSWSPPPSGGEPTAADAEARAGAVFEALADPTRRAVLRDVAEHGPAHGHRAGRRAARQPPGGRQAPRRCCARPGSSRTSAAGRETRFTATLAPLAEAERWLDAHRRGLGRPPGRLDARRAEHAVDRA